MYSVDCPECILDTETGALGMYGQRVTSLGHIRIPCTLATV